MALHQFSHIENIGPTTWNLLKPSCNPFLNYQFLYALEKGHCLGDRPSHLKSSTGWVPQYFYEDSLDHPGILFTFIKSHSYGEYIFDWGWANAYQEYKIPYYPKLTSMIPFTPVTTTHFLMPKFEKKGAERLLAAYEAYYENRPFSSSHFLFLNQEEIPLFMEKNYLIRESLQYHFLNEEYQSFDDFLFQLKKKKAKQIQKERIFPNLIIERLTGDQLTSQHAQEMYNFYLSTIDKKYSMDYLNLPFFLMIFDSLKDHILYVRASQKGEVRPLAGALYFYDQQSLYGRYWGSDGAFPNLHFELCYYQGIEFCIKNQLKIFEAGAQGEHKIPRGFRPMRIYSAHKLKNPLFHQAVASSIHQEKKQINKLLQDLSERLPFQSRPLI